MIPSLLLSNDYCVVGFCRTNTYCLQAPVLFSFESNRESKAGVIGLLKWVLVTLLVVFFAGCGSAPKYGTTGPTIERQSSSAPANAPTKKGGGYYLDDGPGDNPPPNLDSIPDAVPRVEPLRKANMRSYVALGKTYAPLSELGAYKERGIASWYGRRYHGQKTASGEIYDMYGMTAAHTILPLPSYARVTNIKNGRSVVVRVNDRGPFHSDRLIDLSYTAAYKLGVLGGGSALVEVESILPGAEPARRVEVKVKVEVEAERAAVPSVAEKQTDAAKPFLFEVATASVPAPEPELASTPSTAVAPAGAVYLQLGAFGARDNAENFLARLRAELPTLTDSIGIVVKDGLFKVQAGPYADQVLARQAADKIAQSLAIKPVLLVR